MQISDSPCDVSGIAENLLANQFFVLFVPFMVPLFTPAND
jgi:hypothetical protein